MSNLNYKPIVLWVRKPTLASDDACTSILQYQLPTAPSAVPTPYAQLDTGTNTTTLAFVPPLKYFCIKALAQYPEQVHVLGPARLPYEPPSGTHDFDILQALIPTYRPNHHFDFDLRLVHPCLWAVLAQVFHNLPSAFREYRLPLSDVHLPLLQAIPSTEDFSVVTVLSLNKRRELTDDTVLELRHLHTLAVLEASVTALGSFGIQRLAKTLCWSEDKSPERRGPWGLRVLYLKDCININDDVFPWLSRFPLLSVVDLRGTVCKPWRQSRLPFQPTSEHELYNPQQLSAVLGLLESFARLPHTLFSHSSPHFLYVDTLVHTESAITPFRPSPMGRAIQCLNPHTDGREDTGDAVPRVAPAVNRLMLFRTPPPWSALPSAPPPKPTVSKPSRSMPTSVFSTRPGYRSLQPKLTETVTPSDQARKRMYPITSRQNMFDWFQMRSHDQKTAASATSSSASVVGVRSADQAKNTANPFARNAQPTTAANKPPLVRRPPPPHPGAPDQPLPARRQPAATARGSESAGAVASERTRTHIPAKRPFPSASSAKDSKDAPPPSETVPPPAKKLRPISELPIPELPKSMLKPISAYRPTFPTMSQTRMKQTTLSVSREAPNPHARRASAPRMTTNRLQMVRDGKDGKATSPNKPSSETGREGERRRSTGAGKEFNWKGWSGS